MSHKTSAAGTTVRHGEGPRSHAGEAVGAEAVIASEAAMVAGRAGGIGSVIVVAVVAGTGGAELVAICEHGTGEADYRIYSNCCSIKLTAWHLVLY